MVLYIFLSFFFGWLIILTYYLIQTRSHYFRLIERTKKQRIDEILEKLMTDDDKNSLEISKSKTEIEKIIKDSTTHFRKVGLVRFNPFGRTEGEKSFVISLLDGMNNGLVINFIYTHEVIRVYAKKVKEGKGEEYQLAEEEKQAVEKAR